MGYLKKKNLKIKNISKTLKNCKNGYIEIFLILKKFAKYCKNIKKMTMHDILYI